MAYPLLMRHASMLAMDKLLSQYGYRSAAYLMLLLAVAAVFVGGNRVFPASNPWAPNQLVEPATLARQLKASGMKPLLLQVGFRRLYDQGHIPGSKYCGPAFRPAGIAKLRECVAQVPRTREILLYCGCCPWEDCPNIRPAFEALDRMGFKRVKVLYIAHNFGQDWAHQGYPTEP